MNLNEAALALWRGAATALSNERTHINDLNVYPVPDGDTGTNLLLTVQSVVAAVETSDARHLPGLTETITRGCLMGARGNSGVIFSQIVRGACEIVGSATELDGATVGQALASASAAAYRAVKQPVEGTMLTVIRKMSEASARIDDVGVTFDQVLDLVAEAGAVAVEETVDELDVLGRAGVVDAGGYGLLVAFRGMLAARHGGHAAWPSVKTVIGEDDESRGSRHVAGIPADIENAPSLYRYCTSFLLSGDHLDEDEMLEFISVQGDCALVVGDAGMLKVHVHTDHPGTVLSFASAHGAIGSVEVADMREQAAARTARLNLRQGVAGVVAVAAGEGNKALFRELGCSAIVDGGQSMNPSAAQLVEAMAGLDTAEVVLLPNNGNVILTAEQAAQMSDQRVAVVPSASLPAGLAAMVAYDADADAATNAAAMSEALDYVRAAEVTRAVRDSEFDGRVVHEGEVIALLDGALAAAGDDLVAVFRDLVVALTAGDAELLTVVTSLNGSGVTVAELEAAAREAAPHVEVSFHEGGQPHYPILVGAE